MSERQRKNEQQGKTRRDASDPATGREIPRGTDEESTSKNSRVEGSKSAPTSTDPAQSTNDRDRDR